VQLTNGKFVVSHGVAYNGIHQVCLVEAVDENSQFIFVADHSNRRVVLLSPTLEFVRYFREGMLRPRRLYLHQATRRLFVGQSHGFVAVIQL